jgi:hypothetical protein
MTMTALAPPVRRKLRPAVRVVARAVQRCAVLVLAILGLAVNASHAQRAAAPSQDSGSASPPSVPPVTFKQPEDRHSTPLPVQPYRPTRWQVAPGALLRPTLEQWSRAAGWQLVWRYDGDVRVEAGAGWRGSFEHAVKEVMQALPAELLLDAELRLGNSPPLLIVQGRPGAAPDDSSAKARP